MKFHVKTGLEYMIVNWNIYLIQFRPGKIECTNEIGKVAEKCRPYELRTMMTLEVDNVIPCNDGKPCIFCLLLSSCKFSSRLKYLGAIEMDSVKLYFFVVITR